MPTFLYIHGFNSAGFGGKVDILRQAFGAHSVINPSLPPHPAAAMQLLSHLAEKLNAPDFYLIGSSLGGFYALNLAKRYPVKALLVNPAIRELSSGLRTYLGQVVNFKTQEEYAWTEQDLSALDQLELSDADFESLTDRVKIYQDADDEVLPSLRIREFLVARGLNVTTYPGGNHLFQHMDEVIAELRESQE